MSQVPIWFERTFEFSFPLELLPNLCARLRGTPARLEEALRGRSYEILVRPEEGKWSAQEHAGHLLDLEPLWLSRVSDYLAGSSQLTAADLTNRAAVAAVSMQVSSWLASLPPPVASNASVAPVAVRAAVSSSVKSPDAELHT